MPARTITITSDRLLLVEGRDEQLFCEGLLADAGKGDIQVLEYGGKNNLQNTFPAIQNTPGFDQLTWLGIAQDADTDARGAFQRVSGILSRHSLMAPPAPWRVSAAVPAVAVLIWPDGTAAGDLEELLWRAVQQAEPAVAGCIDGYFACLSGSPAHTARSKARIHAYLASRARPDYRLGEAARAGVLPLTSPVFDAFRALLP